MRISLNLLLLNFSMLCEKNDVSIFCIRLAQLCQIIITKLKNQKDSKIYIIS